MSSPPTRAPRPIVWFHRRPCWYLPWTIIQAQTFNPRSPQIALCDVPVEMPGVEWLNIHDYWSGAAAFEEIYHHLSALPYFYDVAAIEKWFVLREWMERNEIDQCFFVDSDVLIYCDIEADEKRFVDTDLTYLPYEGPCNGYINNRESLGRFCEYIMELYQDVPALLERVRAERATAPNFNVNDMSLWVWFKEQDEKLNSSSLCQPNGAFQHDESLQTLNNWTVQGDQKKLIWKNGLPHAIRSDGEVVTMLSLHFVGDKKVLIPSFCTAPLSQRLKLLPRFWPVRLFYFVRPIYRFFRRILKGK